MSALILGLLMFLGMHSARIFADGWRSQVIAQRGAGAWKGLYTVVSLAGFGLIVWGYGQARLAPLVLWASPVWTRHLASLLMLLALVLLVAAYVPGNGIKARLHHPMVLGVKAWAFAHLLANNTLADLLLFGGFLVWAVLDFGSARRRDRAAGTVFAPGRAGATALTVALGAGLWAAFAFWLHAVLFGVRPFGG
ncbi:MAG: NnrU family protein [Burkholderiaceae bacterium]|nr:NnrU family protein [Burkholderiaceae bacterium]